MDSAIALSRMRALVSFAQKERAETELARKRAAIAESKRYVVILLSASLVLKYEQIIALEFFPVKRKHKH